MRYAQNSPPKNITSVARKIHMPRLDELRSSSGVAKIWSNSGLWMSSWDDAGTTAWLSDNLRLLLVPFVDLVVVVGFPSHDGLLREIESGRRRLDRPLEASGFPRIVRRGLAVAHRPQKINHRQQVADSQNGCPGR